MEKRVLLAVVLSFVVLYALPGDVSAAEAAARPAGAELARPGRRRNPTPRRTRRLRRPRRRARRRPRRSRCSSRARRRHRRARHHGRERRRSPRCSPRGRRAQELAAEEIPGCRARAARARSRTTCPPDTPRPFTLADPDAAAAARRSRRRCSSRAPNECGSTSAPATLTFEYQDAQRSHARKEFSFARQSPYVDRLLRDGVAGGADLCCRRCSGARRSAAASSRLAHATIRRRSRSSTATASVSAHAANQGRGERRHRRATSGLPASTITTS